MKHVLFISNLPSRGWGGSEELWSITASRLCEKGHRVSVDVISSANNSRLVEITNFGGSVHQRSVISAKVKQFAEVILRDKRDGELSKLKQVALNRSLNSSWYRRLNKLNPDLVVIGQSDNYNGWDWMHACAVRKIPFVTIAQSASENAWPTLSQSEFIAKNYNIALRQYFVSQRNIDLTRMQLLTPLNNAEVVRNPFSVSYKMDSVTPMPEMSRIKLACVGRFHFPSKGQDLICQVMAMQKWRERAVDVVFYGSGEHGTSIQKMIDQMGLTNVTIGGYQKDIRSIWNNFHGLLLPSRYEGLPLVVVEAMLCGRVPIVTDVAGNSEIIEHEKTGYLSTAPTVSELDKTMELAWTQHERWPEMGIQAAKCIRELVPEDPAEVLATKIEAVLAGM